MTRFCRVGLLAIGLLVAVGCGPQPQPTIPTVAVLPTIAPTATPRPTFTALPTTTPTPTATASITATATHTPISPTMTRSATPSATLAQSLTPSLTPSYTPGTPQSPNGTAGAVGTPGVIGQTTAAGPPPILGPAITAFNADAVTGKVTLSWVADADTLTLVETTGSGTPVTAIGVPNIGKQAFPLDQRYGASVSFQLVADRNGQSVTKTLTIPIGCPIDWFFTPAPADCPSVAVQVSDGEYQPFQRGIGFYSAASNTVYLLSYAGSLVVGFPIGDHYTTPVPLTVPAGYSAPAGHIGAIWQSGTWPDGQRLRQLFGWAISPPETYRISIEPKASTDLYLNSPTNAIYELNLSNGGSWTVVIGLH